jgi:hypothetical protein
MPIPATTAPNGWLLYEKPTEGFALTLPPDWKHYDRTKESVEEMLKKAEQRNPEMGHSVGGLEAQLAQAYSFFGVDEQTLGTGLATSVNIGKLKMTDAGITTLEDGVQQGLRQLEQLTNVAKPIAHERLQLNGSEAERIQYTATLVLAKGEPVRARITQYMLLHGGYQFAVTFTTRFAQADRYASTFDQIAQSFRFLDAVPP